MQKIEWNDTTDYIIAAITGGALAAMVLKAFVLGAVGAAGGVFFKWCWAQVKKKFKK